MDQYSNLTVHGKIKQKAAQGDQSDDVVLYPTLTTLVPSAIPQPNQAGKAIVVNEQGNGYTLGEAGKVDGVKLGTSGSSPVALTDKYAIIPVAGSTTLGVIKFDTSVGNNTSRTDVAISESGIKTFVNSSISTNTAYFLGTYDVESLELTDSATHEQVVAKLNTKTTWEGGRTPSNNDYCFVYFDLSQDPGNVDRYERYKYDGATWAYEYTLNNSSFTSSQWAAINSGITSLKVSGYNTHVADTKIHVPETTDVGYLLISRNNSAPVWRSISGSGYYSDGAGNIVITNTTYTGSQYIAINGTVISHDNVPRDDYTSSATPSFGGTFTVIDSVTTNNTGHVTAVNTKTVQLPSNPNTDSKVQQKGITTDGEYPILLKYDANTSNVSANYTNFAKPTDKVPTINPSTGVVTANGGFVGHFTGDVTGNLSGNVVGNVTGNVTGNCTGSAGSVQWNGVLNQPFTAYDVEIYEVD